MKLRKYNTISWKRIEPKLEGYIAGLMIGIYSAIIIGEVIMRALFNTQTLWGFSVVLGIFAWVSWLTASLCIRTDSHLRFTLIRKNLSNRMNYLLRLLDVLFWFIVVGAVFYYSVDQLLVRASTGVMVEGTSVPTYLLYAAVPVGTGFMLMRAFQKVLIITKKYRNGENIVPDASI